ncbi:MAG TPA: PHP domain-containing protein [Candidatus Binataceae bacterium]|nr:PHP domain-containing protein [Candidatus Binataceae bacterium]
MSTTLDLHCHSEASDDSRAPVEAYLKWIALRRHERPLDGIVLTEHRQFNAAADYRALEDKYGLLILNACEAETDYGHMLVFGVNRDIVRRFDFKNIRLPAQELIDGVAELGGAVVPCHPGRPTVGLCEYYAHAPALHNIVAVERFNGGSRKGEDERAAALIEQYRYRGTGGSDSHLVSLIGLCATRFEKAIRTSEQLVEELKQGNFSAVDFRPARQPVPRASAT